MIVRFQADADLNQAIVTGTLRRDPQVDFQTANTANLEGVSDAEVLAIAARHHRILVSHDRRTMPVEFGQVISKHQSAGVIIVSRKLTLALVITELLTIWEISTAEEWLNRIAKLPL